jgi:hypothetical protein
MSTFEASYHGIGEMIRSEFMLAEMARRGSNIFAVAVATAPVGHLPRDMHAGRYKASFGMELNRRGGIHNDRAEAKVTNDAFEAIFVEYGHEGDNEPYHTLFHAMMIGGAM